MVRNQINIINNNQSQQIFSKDPESIGIIQVPIEEFEINAYKGNSISNKNKKFLSNAQVNAKMAPNNQI